LKCLSGSRPAGGRTGWRPTADLRRSAVILCVLLPALCGCGRAPAGPNVVLVVIDTFRADHASFTGYNRETTPVLDSLAECGASWTSFRSQSSWTLPAFASILTGLTPREHMAGRRDGVFYGLDPDLPTIQKLFRIDGYRTAAFFNVVFLNEDFGFHVGFDHFGCSGFTNRASLRRAGETVNAFLGWLDGFDPSSGPFLAVVHFYDPHMPYDPPHPYSDLFTDPGYDGPCDSSWGRVTELMAVNDGLDSIPADGLRNLEALYDGELAYSDAELGRLLQGLRDRGLDGSTVILVTGDHGEEFLEHGGIEHGRNLYEETVRVPLVMAGPGVPSLSVDEPASHVDILPTLTALCGLDAPMGLAGRNLLAAPDDDAEAHGLCTAHASGVLWADGDRASSVLGDRKVVLEPNTGEAAMFDLSSDPREESPLPPDSVLLEDVLAYWATPARGRPGVVDFAETVDRALRDLGYIR